MHIEYFSEFVDLARTLSYSETARRLHITQPSLTRHIVQLEKGLRVALLKRTTRNVELTSAGRLLLEKIEPIVSAYNEAIRSILESSRNLSKKLRIAFPYQLIERYLQSELDRFMNDYEDVRIELIPIAPQRGEQILLDGGCDISFDIVFPNVKPNSHFVGRILGVVGFCVCLPSKHHLARKKKISPRDLSGCTFIKASDYPQYNAFVDDFIQMFEIKSTRTVTADSIELIHVTALAENAIEIRMAIPDMQEHDGISYVPLDSDMNAKIRIVRLDPCENPVATLLV